MARTFQPACYLVASRRNGTLYCGSTSDLVKRVWEHREADGARFTATYGVHRLVWFEFFDEMGAAMQRERRIKAWRRAWKLALIERDNPTWRDLYEDLG